ncbi:MAG: histidine kinase, partial [bacterium]|nr:histidine kinase [bacterium]
RLIGELEARNAELARFNYTVSHDLKNPLVTIKNFLGVLRRDTATGQTGRLERDLDRLEAAADTLHRLLEQLFEFSRVGVQANPPEEISMDELVRAALEEIAGPIAERGVEVVVAEQLPVVRGDRVRLLEMARHLLGNAVTYLGDQAMPRIEVGMRDDPSEPVLYVRDNGVGIDPKYHEKIFGLFERLAPEASEGTGIGLALVKRIVEVHGGRIWVESEGAGRGSTFCFTLPYYSFQEREFP